MKKILVIGASRGLGREFVRQYLGAGDAVTATARRPEDVAELESLGATAFALDVGDAASASGLAWRVDGARFDVVLIVAGVLGPHTRALETPSEADFDLVMRTNVLGPMRLIPQLAEALVPGGVLGVLSSRMGSIGTRTSTDTWLYRASKAALNSVLKDASLTFAGRATCVALHPGWVKTDMGGDGADLTPEKSISDLRRTIAGLSARDNGGFFNHDGNTIPW